jgi:biotin synthase
MESPEYLRMSLAAAMTLGFKEGLFYRNAKSPCVNVLLTYDSGCGGNCAYCGLSHKRIGEHSKKSFIRVGWPAYKLSDIVERIKEKNDKVERICISMITNGRAKKDTIYLTQVFNENLDIPISLLIAPTILKREDLIEFKKVGAERIGISIDAATPELFENLRGSGVNGPHKWDKYWTIFEDALEIFGKRMVGIHLIVGLGETEKDMANVIQKVYDMGGTTHLFSFYPEVYSALENNAPPPIEQYRRIQLARYIIDEGITEVKNFIFDESEKIKDFGIPQNQLKDLVKSGKPFITSGCPNKKGEVACNRPYSNSRPGEEIRNFPFYPEEEDIKKIEEELEIKE